MHLALKALRECQLAADWKIALASTLESVNAVLEYVHSNGFRKILLRSFDDGSRLRLHLWEDTAEQNIHDHRWGFTSLVLTGGIEERLYARSDDLMHEFNVYKHTRFGLEHLPETCRMAEIQLSRHPAGSIYQRGIGVVHLARPYISRTASIVATDPPGSAVEALVFSLPGRKPVQVQEQLRKCSRQEIFDQLCLYDSRGNG